MKSWWAFLLRTFPSKLESYDTSCFLSLYIRLGQSLTKDWNKVGKAVRVNPNNSQRDLHRLLADKTFGLVSLDFCWVFCLLLFHACFLRTAWHPEKKYLMSVCKITTKEWSEHFYRMNSWKEILLPFPSYVIRVFRIASLASS